MSAIAARIGAATVLRMAMEDRAIERRDRWRRTLISMQRDLDMVRMGIEPRNFDLLPAGISLERMAA